MLTGVAGTSAGVVAGSPSTPGQNCSPRLLRVQSRLSHPVVWTHVYDIQLSEVFGEVFERHPKNSAIGLKSISGFGGTRRANGKLNMLNKNRNARRRIICNFSHTKVAITFSEYS